MHPIHHVSSCSHPSPRRLCPAVFFTIHSLSQNPPHRARCPQPPLYTASQSPSQSPPSRASCVHVQNYTAIAASPVSPPLRRKASVSFDTASHSYPSHRHSHSHSYSKLYLQDSDNEAVNRSILPTIQPTHSATRSYPRRRLSLSVHSSDMPAPPSSTAQQHFFPSSRRAPRRRARTMPFSIRAPKERSSRSKKIVIAILIILSLFLVGTIVVLSSVSYSLALPSGAFLTEEEVPWRPQDAISPLKYDPTTLPSGNASDSDHDPSAEWDVDGRGSGGYWMRKDWDGLVEQSEDWSHLYNATTLPGESIPRIIHQTWKNGRLPEKWRKAWKECREGMTDYAYMLWTDETSRRFIEKYYPNHLRMFDSYKYPIQRADSIRYFVLLHFGGIYMDLDIGCRRRLDPLLQGDWDAILPITKPVGVSNDLVFSSKGSPFMDHTVHALPAWDHEWLSNYPTVMFSTGPMFLSAQYAIYSSAHPVDEAHPRADVRILPKSLYGKNAPIDQVPHSFFAHFYGSSWHADDAGFVTFLGAWGTKLMYIGFVVIFLAVCRLVYLRLTGASSEYQLLSVLPTSTASENSSPSNSRPPTPFTPNVEALAHNQLPSEITRALRRAGDLILAAPATLLSGDRRSARRRQGLLYFVPAIFQATKPSRRGRTASEASQLPLRRPRRERGDFMEQAPPPYETVHESTPLTASPKQTADQKLASEDEDSSYPPESSSSDSSETADWDWRENSR